MNLRCYGKIKETHLKRAASDLQDALAVVTRLKRIAKELGKSASTVSRELRRNSRAVDRNTDYFEQAHAAQDAAHERRVAASKKSHLSPELTAGRLKIDHPGYSISRESIYQYIIKERTELAGYLPNAGKKRRKRHSSKKRRVKPVATPKQSIEERFQEANERLSIGHLERD